MKRLLLLTLLMLCVVAPMRAVLNEKNLPQTLSVLRNELETNYKEQQINMQRLQVMNEQQHEKLKKLMENSSLTSLMLYSQKQDYTFDMTYACHEATKQYREFNVDRLPYDKIVKRIDYEISRYDGLIRTLEHLPPSLVKLKLSKEMRNRINEMRKHGQPFMLSKQGQADRAACLKYAIELRANLVKVRKALSDDQEHYTLIGKRLKEINDFATDRYKAIQQSIFVNGDDSYFKIISRFPRYSMRAMQDINDKYDMQGKHSAKSDWRGPIVLAFMFFVLFYLVVASLLSVLIVNVSMRFVKRLQTEELRQKKPCITLGLGVLIFALTIAIIRLFFNHSFFIMASELLVEYAWMLGAILMSLLIRLNGSQIKSGFRVYTPIVMMAFIIIAFRIIFIPNSLVNLIFPPLLLLFSIWQWNVIRRKVNNLPRSDMFYAWISLAVIVVSAIMAWGGYVLMAVQLFIWWLFQLTAIQTITCCFDLLDVYERKHILSKLPDNAKVGEFINITWFYDLVRMTIVPIVGAMSIIWCIWFSADVFDLKDTCAFIFMTPFLDVKDVCQLSLFKLVLVIELFFVFRYVSYVVKSFYKYYRLRSINEELLSSVDDEDEEDDEMTEEEKIKAVEERRAKRAEIARNSNFTLFNNVTAILVWGTYFVFALVLLQVPKSGISIVTAGLATGVGFAMKDILNNFFYGIQLMAGRVRVGDFIECDGILGKVDSITYQSTQIITPDGCVIAFLNSTLFSKNFKNLTRNHQYELVKIPVGVAYGTDVEKVRTLLLKELHLLAESKNMAGRHIVDRKRPLGVAFSNFGDSSVDLLLTMWIRVEDKVAFVARVKEMVYKVFNENDIEIPFPQQDIYIRKVVDKEK